MHVQVSIKVNAFFLISLNCVVAVLLMKTRAWKKRCCQNCTKVSVLCLFTVCVNGTPHVQLACEYYLGLNG